MNIFDSRNPSHMQHDFSKIPHADIQRSLFKRSHTHKTAFNAGYLIPVYVDEVLPGDTFNLNVACVARLSTPVVPFMDNLFIDFHFFFVPNRLVWEHWQNFMGEKTNPDDTVEYSVPTIDISTDKILVSTLYDYMGIPINKEFDSGLTYVNALPFRAYNLIYNEWFRDQNLQDSIPCAKDDGQDGPGDYVLRKRGKRHDYFTSCLPWPQKGADVEMPLGAFAPVVGRDQVVPYDASTYAMRMRYAETGNIPGNEAIINVSGNNLGRVYAAGVASTYSLAATLEPSNLWANLAEAQATTINSFREAIQLQRLLERDARGGTRYTEILQSHFGVTSPDARLQRPEFLGGGTLPINIHSVPQTSSTDATTPQGNMAAYGYASGSHIGFSKAFVEHGYVIGLASVRADLTYQQGINRMWTRSTKYDFYWPALAHLGEQEVLNREIYYQNTTDDDEIFGYQERWAEYRYHPSRISGVLRSQYATPLDYWHLAQEFNALPVLGPTFIEENPPLDRVVAVQSEPHIIFDGYFDLRCARPMPMYSVPGLVDHF